MTLEERVFTLQDPIITANPEMNVYICTKTSNVLQPTTKIIGVSIDLVLINELAINCFQSAVAALMPETAMMSEGHKDALWYNAPENNGDGMSWFMDRYGCVILSATYPGTNTSVEIRVTARPFTTRYTMAK